MSQSDNAHLPKMPLQVVVVGTQFVPNVAAVIDEDLAVEHCVLLHTADKKAAAEQLAAVQKRYGVQPHLFEMSSAFEPQKIATDIVKLEAWLEKSFPDLTPTINITIGSKLTSLLYANYAQKRGWPIIYVNPKDQLLWLNELHAPVHPLADRMKIEDYFEAAGYKVLSRQRPRPTPVYPLVLNELINRLNEFEKPLRQLNYITQQGSSRKSRALENPHKNFEALIQLLKRVGGIDWDAKNKVVTYKNREVRFFANGGWLEEYIAIQINRVASQLSKLQDHAMSVEVENIKTGVRNELDNVVLYDNKLFVIECKTKHFKQNQDSQNAQGDGVNAIYKLDALVDVLGGVYGKGMLATIFPLNMADEIRAQDYHIKIIKSDQLKDLSTQLSTWLMSGK
jgi:hypothetical protein